MSTLPFPRWFAVVRLVAVLALGSLVSAAAPEPRFALLIGNNDYLHAPNLRNAVNDANDLGAVLKELGFSVQVVTNADRRTMEESIDRFVGSLSPGSVALFLFSGHGMQIDQENYLVPVDFELKDEASVRYDAYPASKVHDRVAHSGVRLNIVILDACRNNGFTASRAASTGLAAMNAARGSFIAFSTAPGSTASDNPRGRNGLFTSYLLETIRQPGLKLDEVFNRVRQGVYQASENKQLAWTSSSVIGDFYFLPDGAAPPAPQRDLVLAKDSPPPAARVEIAAAPAPTSPLAAPPRQAAAPATPAAPAGQDAAEDRLLKLVSRAAAVRGSLDNLRAEQARQGVSLRADMAAAFEQMELLLNQADSSVGKGDVRRGERAMDQLEPVLQKLEKFLGQ
jgi:Caspase domain